MRRLLVTLIVVAAPLAVAPAASAQRVLGGFGDQHADTFYDPSFRALGVKRTRLIAAWDDITKNPGGVAAWMSAVRANRLQPLIAFNPSRGMRCPGSRCRAPSVSAFSRAFKRWRRAYPWVRYYNFWNETNSPTQPTSSIRRRGRAIKHSALLYRAAVRACGRRCTVTGPDMLDLGIGDRRSSVRSRAQKRMKQWLAIWLRAARQHPKIWGLHNYGDTNYRRSTGTAFFLKQVKGQVWVTETGGIYSFRLQSGRQTFAPSASRQARATRYAYTLANRYRSRIRRLYFYQWRQRNPADYFDAGIVAFDGSLRPAYTQLRRLRTRLFR